MRVEKIGDFLQDVDCFPCGAAFFFACDFALCSCWGRHGGMLCIVADLGVVWCGDFR